MQVLLFLEDLEDVALDLQVEFVGDGDVLGLLLVVLLLPVLVLSRLIFTHFYSRILIRIMPSFSSSS
jgi:hypothetical protein